MINQSESPDKPMKSPLSQLVQSIFSDNNNIMLAAIISLLLVILFVLLLHVYAKWFLAQAHARHRHRRRRSGVLGPARFHHLHSINIEDSLISSSHTTKGLDLAIVAAIPMFIYEAEAEEGDGHGKHEEEELECVICLSAFEDGETGRSLPKCGHAFHVECIDMWLYSHCNCPICRAPIVGGIVQNDSRLGSVDGDDDDPPAVLEIVIDTPSYDISVSENGNESGNDNGGGVSTDSISETSSSLLGCSLKRMLSKVFISSNVNELDA